MLQHQQNHKPQQNISPQSRRRASVARIVAEGERHLQNIRRQSPPSQHQHQSASTTTSATVEVKNHTHSPSSGSTTTVTVVAKPKTSIFDLDANLAHLRDTAIDLETKRDEVDPNIENLRAEELPPEMRRELKDIPEERAHQAHRARYREHWMIASPGSPSANGAFASSSPSYSRMVKHEHTTNHASSPDHQVGSTTRFVSPPLRYDNNNVKQLSPNHNHHAIDRYSKAELSRGVQPDGVPVDSFFHSPHAVREKKLGERSIDEVLNEEHYRITDAKRRADAAEKMIPESQRKRKEINEKCYADMIKVVGGILNKKNKKKVLRENESKTNALLRRQKRAVLGKSDNDDDTTSSSDDAKSRGRNDDASSTYFSSDDDDDDDGSSLSSIDFDSRPGSAEEEARRRRRKNKQRRKKGKREKGRKKHESRLQEILDIVDSVLYDDNGKPSNRQTGAGSGSDDPLSNSIINADDLFQDDFIATQGDDDFFEVGSDMESDDDYGTDDGSSTTGKRTPGGTRIVSAANTYRFGKRLKKKAKKTKQDAESAAKAKQQMTLTEEQEKAERQKQAVMRAKAEQERLKKMRAQLQAKRNEQQSEKKAAAKSNWFKKAIHSSPAAASNRLGESRNSVHPLRSSGTMSPGSVRKMLDVEFADDHGDDDDEDDDDLKKLEATLLGDSDDGLNDESPKPDRPETSAANIQQQKSNRDNNNNALVSSGSENDDDDHDDSELRAQLAKQAALAAKSIFNKDANELDQDGNEDGSGLMRRKSMLLSMPDDENLHPENDEGNIPDDGYDWKIMGNETKTGKFIKDQQQPVINKSMLEMRQIPNCPQGIYLIQERVSRHEAIAEVFIGNRSDTAQWMMIDFTNVIDTMDVQPDPIIASIGDEKHLCCSAPTVKLHIATVRRLDGNPNGEMSLFRQNLEVLPLTAQEALLLKATMNRLAEQNKITGPSGTDDVFDPNNKSGTLFSPTDASLNASSQQQHMSIASSAISKFLQQRNDDRKKEEMKSTRRHQKSMKGGLAGTVTFVDSDGNTKKKSTNIVDPRDIHDAELQAVMKDAIANSSIDAESLLLALNKLRSKQELEASDSNNKRKGFSSSMTTTKGGGASSSMKRGGAAASMKGGNKSMMNSRHSPVSEDEDVDAATRQLLKSVNKIKKEKKLQKEREKAEKEAAAAEAKERERQRKITEKQLQDLEKHKRRLGDDQKYMVGSQIDAAGAASFLEKNASLVAPGGTTHQKEEDIFHKKTGKGKRVNSRGKRKQSQGESLLSASQNAQIQKLLSDSAKKKNEQQDAKSEEDKLSASQKLRNEILLATLNSTVDDDDLPHHHRGSATPYVRAQLTPEQILEDEKERQRLKEEADLNKRPGTGGSNTSRSSTAHLLPVPSLSVEEKEEIERKQKELEEKRRASNANAHSVLLQDGDGGENDDENDPLNKTRLTPNKESILSAMMRESNNSTKNQEEDEEDENDQLSWGKGVGVKQRKNNNNNNVKQPSSRGRGGAQSRRTTLIVDDDHNNPDNNNDQNRRQSQSGSGRGGFSDQRGRSDSTASGINDHLRGQDSSFGKSKSGGFLKSSTGRNSMVDSNNNSKNSFRYSQSSPSFGTSVKGGPTFGKGPSASTSNNASSLRSSIKINNSVRDDLAAKSNNKSSMFRSGGGGASSISKNQQEDDASTRQQQSQKEKNNLEENDPQDDDIFDDEVVPGLTNEEAKTLIDDENEKTTRDEQDELKKSIAERILGTAGSPTKSFLESQNDDNDDDNKEKSPSPNQSLRSNSTSKKGLEVSMFLSDGTLSKKGLDQMADMISEMEKSLSPAAASTSSRRHIVGKSPNQSTTSSDPQHPPDDFVQNPLLSDRILTEAFEKVLQVAKEAEDKQAEEEAKEKGLASSILDRDLNRNTSTFSPHQSTTGEDPSSLSPNHRNSMSPSYRSPSTALRELMGESMFRKAMSHQYIPNSRPPLQTDADSRRAHQSRVRASILNAPVLSQKDKNYRWNGDDNGDEDLDGENVEQQQNDEASRPNTARVIHDLVRDHVELTFNLRQELAGLARMLRCSKSDADIAALRKAILTTAWKYQRGREINLRKLIVLLERKTHHRKWLPFIVNENIYADLPGFDDSVLPSTSGRMYGSWKFNRGRIYTGPMHTMMVLAATNNVVDVPSIPSTASFELQDRLIPGATRMNLSPKPPSSASGRNRNREMTGKTTSSSLTTANTARNRRFSAIAASREGRGCKFYGVLHLSAEAEERKMNEEEVNQNQNTSAVSKDENNTQRNSTTNSSLPVISKRKTSQQYVTLTVSAFANNNRK